MAKTPAVGKPPVTNPKIPLDVQAILAKIEAMDKAAWTQSSQRIAQVRAKLKYVKTFTFIHYHTGGDIEHVYCRLCGVPIKSLAPDPTYEERQIIKGKTIITQRLILVKSPDYREIAVTFDDGTENITHICETCLDQLHVHEADKLEEMYAADLFQWRDDELKGRGRVRWFLMNRRHPTGHRRL